MSDILRFERITPDGNSIPTVVGSVLERLHGQLREAGVEVQLDCDATIKDVCPTELRSMLEGSIQGTIDALTDGELQGGKLEIDVAKTHRGTEIELIDYCAAPPTDRMSAFSRCQQFRGIDCFRSRNPLGGTATIYVVRPPRTKIMVA